MFYKILEIEGIAPEHMRKLEKAGITTTEHLLAQAGDAKARERLAVSTGIGEKSLAKWAAMADLMRVKGIGQQYSELLVAVGVDLDGEAPHVQARCARPHDERAEKDEEAVRWCSEAGRCRAVDGFTARAGVRSREVALGARQS